MKRQQSPDCITNERLGDAAQNFHPVSTVKTNKGAEDDREGVHKPAQICRHSKKQEKTVIKKGTSVSEVT